MEEKEFPEILAGMRSERGMTQEEVAAALSVSNKTVSKWERGDSSPDLASLVRLAELFEVTTDTLLGVSCDRLLSENDFTRDDLSRLGYPDSALRSFGIVRSIIPTIYGSISRRDEGGSAAVPETAPGMPRSRIVTDDFFDLTVNSDNVNLAVMLLRNKSDFSWLSDEGSLNKISELFTDLSRVETLKIYAFIHNAACSETFTADYISKNTGVDLPTATDVLDRAVGIGLCTKHKAHLEEGDAVIYGSYGEGMILSAITLAYEYMCGARGYDYNCGGTCKMIGGEK